MGLLNSDKVYFNVKNSVLEIIERLLTLEEDADENETSNLFYIDSGTNTSLKSNLFFKDCEYSEATAIMIDLT